MAVIFAADCAFEQHALVLVWRGCEIGRQRQLQHREAKGLLAAHNVGKHLDHIITGSESINYVRSVVDGEVQPREVALQVKSGESYNSETTCDLPATAGHIDFWARHDLITLGIVYDPKQDLAFWVDLQTECRERKRRRHTGGATINFDKAAWNRFDDIHFPTVLVPTLLGQAPTVSFATALSWASSSDWDTHAIGVRTLLARHKQVAETWTCLVQEFRRRTPDTLSIEVPIGFCKILGHCDIGDYTGIVGDDVRQPVRAALQAFSADDIAKLLLMLEDDESFERGQLGYGLYWSGRIVQTRQIGGKARRFAAFSRKTTALV